MTKRLPPNPVDPTANVFALVSAETKRQDDLREAEGRRQDELREKTDRCAHELLEAEKKSAIRLADVEAKWRDARDLAESRRVDSNMATQQQNARFETEKLATTATTLAGQVAEAAGAMRDSVAATAREVTAQISVLRESHDRRITELEQNRYQLGGRADQRVEGRQMGQWAVYIFIIVAIAVVEGLAKLFVH